MSRSKPRRPGTKSGRRAESIAGTNPFERAEIPKPRAKVRLPSDLADAAEAALDDMLASMPDPEPVADDEPKTETRAPSHEDVVPQDDDDDELLTVARRDDERATVPRRDDTAAVTGRRSQMPLPAPPRTTSAHTVEPRPIPPPPMRPTPPVTRPTPPATRPTMPEPVRPTPAPTRLTPPEPVRPTLPATRPTPMPPVTRSTPATRPTPTPPVTRPTPPEPVRPPPRAHTRSAPPAVETPHEASERATGHREPASDAAAGDPDQLRLDPAIDTAPVDPDQLAPERPELATLEIAVYEESSQLATAQGAIVAAGHVVGVGAGGREGVSRVVDAIRGGSVDAVLVALPGGESIIDAAHALEPRRPIVIASLAGSPVDAVARAQAAGADLVVMRPHDVERLAPILLAAARLCTEKRISLAARGAEQVLRARIDELSEPRGLLPFEMFQRVLELEIKRAKRFEYPLSVALFAVEVEPPPPPAGIRGILRARAGNVLINTIRDIDIATQLDHERFLVLLPYTDLKGSAGLGRRVIAAVAAGDPVVAGGRSFPPRLVGAVAGGGPGQPLSFAKLMKEATRALEQARRDGAELAVQP